MRIRNALTLVTIAVLCAVTVGMAGGAVRPAEGITFDIRVTLTTPQPTGGMTLFAKGKYSNGVIRIDPTVVAGASPIVEGEYIILNDSGSFSVRPASRTWTEKSIEIGTLNTMMNSINGGSTIHDFVVKVDTLGPADPIEGRPTRHFRVNYSFITRGRGGDRPTNNVYEYWITDLGVPMMNPFDHRTSVTGPRAPLIAPLIPQLVQMRVAMGKGTVVKIVGTNGQGFTRKVDLTNVQQAQFDDSVFVIPKDFRHVAAGGRGR